MVAHPILQSGADVHDGSDSDLTAPKCDFRYRPESRLNLDIAPCPFGARSRHGTSRIRGHQFGGEAFHRLTLSSHNTSSCNRVWETWAIIVVRQRMPASVLTSGRAQLAVVGLF